MERGTYTLLLRLDDPVELTVGALGEVAFEAGWYAYTGSAMGSGGLKRVARHREIARGGREVRHWHIDHLLPHTEIDAVGVTPGADEECRIARKLPGDRVAGFGCTDCGCGSHLAVAPEQELRGALTRLHAELRSGAGMGGDRE